MFKTEQETRYFTAVLLTGNKKMTCQWNKNKVLQLGFLNPLHKYREGIITWHNLCEKHLGDFLCVLQVSQWCGLAAKEGMPIRAGVGVPCPAPGSLSFPICPLYWSDDSREHCCHF